jgi:hypothetical protein
VTVTAERRFRPSFQAVMDAKGWDAPDIVMGGVSGHALCAASVERARAAGDTEVSGD